MLRTTLFAAGLCLAVPAFAQDAPGSAGRYQIAPDEDGFVRLDTETGALSHCGRRDGIWRCEALAEQTEMAETVAGLRTTVDRLTDEVARLNERIAALEARPVPAPPAAEGTQPDGTGSELDSELDRALGFFDELMQRFLDMVRELKKEDEPSRNI